MNLISFLLCVTAVYCGSDVACALPDKSDSVAEHENLLYMNNQSELISTNLPFLADYSVGKTFCSKCKNWIPKNAIQIGVMQMSATENNLKPIWCDKSCFFEIRQPLSVYTIDGFSNLRYNDQKDIRKHLGVDEPLDAELEKQVAQQNADYFVTYDKLKTLQTEDHISILQAQNQFVPKDSAQILTHAADVITFGALPPCPICKSQLMFRNTGHYCTGYDSPWSKCLFGIKDAERVPLTIPAQYQTLFGEKTQPRNRIIQSDFRISDEDFEYQAKQPLFGMEFLIIGETERPKSDIEDKIRKMGGKIVPNIHRGVAAVISNAHEVQNAGVAMNDAFLSRIQVLPEDFIDEVMSNNPIEVFNRKDMNKRGKFIYERIPERKPKDMEVENKVDGPKVNTWQWKSGAPDLGATAIYNSEQYKIYQNGDLKYSVMLNFVDIASNKNSYHKLQLVTSNQNSYFISESKGRIGTSKGSSISNSFGSLDNALKEFNRIYLESTGNEFGASEFVKKPGKYHRVEIDHKTLDRKIAQNSKPTTLAEPVYKLMQLIFDENMLQSSLQAFYFDLGTLPLGLINNQTLQDAIAFLEEISTKLNAKTTPNLQEIVAISNQFHSYFPHNSHHERAPIINTLDMIKEIAETLRNVLDKLEKYNSFATKSAEEKNLIDVCYDHLNHYAEIRPLNKRSKMYAHIVKYVKNSQTYSTKGTNQQTNNNAYNIGQNGRLEVDEIFQVTRHEEEIRYAPYADNFNRQLLFHGTAVQNILSILTNGLRLQRSRGGNYGAGIYFADSILRSGGFSNQNADGSTLFFLCEVAAGLADVRYHFDGSKLKENSESLQGIGQWYPSEFTEGPGGLKIPNGELISRPEQTGLQFNEFVLFDEARVRIRYIIKLKLPAQQP